MVIKSIYTTVEHDENINEIILNEDFDEELTDDLVKIIGEYEKVNMGMSFNKPIDKLFEQPNKIETLFLGI